MPRQYQAEVCLRVKVVSLTCLPPALPIVYLNFCLETVYKQIVLNFKSDSPNPGIPRFLTNKSLEIHKNKKTSFV